MVQMYVIHTCELDNPDIAVQELMQSLPLDAIKNKNVIGILTVQKDAVTSGVVTAISEAMPFDVLGMTVFAASGDNEVDMSMVSLVLLVSETLTFSTAVRDLSSGYKEEIAAMHAEIQRKSSVQPSLGLVFASFLRHSTGQELVSYLSDMFEGMPLFGGLASDFTYFSDDAFVFYNGQIFNRAMVLLCVSGPVRVSFLYGSLLADELQSREAVITESYGNTIVTVNDMPISEYLRSLGFSMDELAVSGTEVPFLVNCHDGTPMLARELVGVTSDKHVYFGGDMPKGASIYISMQTAKSVLDTTRAMLQHIKKKEDALCGVLFVNCSERSVILASEPLQEAIEALELFGKTVPYHHCYVRGEICPALLADGQWQNRFHNFTSIACMFEKN